MPQLDQINIVVRDMAAAVAFYRMLGVEVSDTMAEWQAHHREIASTSGGLRADLDSAAFAPRTPASSSASGWSRATPWMTSTPR
jgi:catechol 2,3-dioxygenase-like lactoylglutathione lyase family enzyme